MKVFFKPSFIKDFSRLPKEIKKEINRLCAADFVGAQNPHAINNIKVIQGFKDYYRIRIRDYRIGFKMEDKNVIFMRVLHRKDIYRYFP